MTPTNPTRSTTAHRGAVATFVVLVVVAATLIATTSDTRDADARPASAPEVREDRNDGQLLLMSERQWAQLATDAAVLAEAERIHTERLNKFYAAVAAAEAERVAAERLHQFYVAVAAAEAERVAAERAAASRSSMGGGWAALRRCESGGNYGAVSASGTYRGAYQFSRSTWNGVAARSHPHLVGVDPAAAAPADQDAMALSLYRSSGARPWPHCGKHL